MLPPLAFIENAALSSTEIVGGTIPHRELAFPIKISALSIKMMCLDD